jgi:hypothetical protein
MSLFSNPLNIQGFVEENSYKFTPRKLNTQELDDLKTLTEQVSYDAFLKSYTQRGADSYYQRLVQDSINPDSTYNPLDIVPQTKDSKGPIKTINTEVPVDGFFSRFKKRNNPQEQELLQIAEQQGLSNLGQIGYDQYSNEFRYGTLGFHGASLTANMDGPILELMHSNQNSIWAKTLRNFNMDMFEKSPAFAPKQEPQWLLQEKTDGLQPFYTYRDGSPVTKGSLGLVSPESEQAGELVTPETLLGIDTEGRAILAKDNIPMELVDRGLTELKRTTFEESFWQYNKDTVNNWGRLGRVGDYGLADQTVFSFLDISNFPVLDIVNTMINPKLTNPDIIAKDFSTKINSKQLVAAIKERDPLWYNDMLAQGIDINKLEAMPTAGMFRSYVNGMYQKNAIARALRTIQISDGWWWDKFYKTREMVYGTLVAGDAVSQIGLTVVSLGTNLAVAGGLTASRLAPATITSSAARIAAVRAGLGTRVGFGTGFARNLQSVVRWLPANIPSTIIELGLKKLPRSTGFRAWQYSDKLGVRSLYYGGRGAGWIGGQAIEGFVEEGVTDVVNQNYELALGLRNEYDWSQTLSSSIEGALYEPFLGGVLAGPVFLVGLTGGTIGRAGLNSTVRWFGLDSARASEFNLYLSTLNGSFDELTPYQQLLRQEMVIRGLVMEEALGPISSGVFTKAETAVTRFSQMGLTLRSNFGNVSIGNFVDASLILNDVVGKWQTEWDNGNLEIADQIEKAEQLGLVTTDTNGQIKLTETSTELFLNFIVSGVFGDQSGVARRAFIDREFRTALTETVKASNPELVKKIEEAEKAVNDKPDDDTAKQTLKTALEEFDKKVKEFSTDPAFETQKKELLQKVTDKATLALSLFPQNQTLQNTDTFSQATRTTIEMSQARLENQLEPIERIVGSVVKPKQKETPVAPEEPVPGKETVQQGTTPPPEEESSGSLMDWMDELNAAIDLFTEEVAKISGLDIEVFKGFLSEYIRKPDVNAELLLSLAEVLSKLPTDETKIDFIEQLGCRKG